MIDSMDRALHSTNRGNAKMGLSVSQDSLEI
jgi:hypothetical protein